MRKTSSANAPAARSPTKKSRSPKKATFKFSFKNMVLRFKRQDCPAQLCDGMGPIHTAKRTGRSMSDPVLLEKRMHIFDGEDEEKDSSASIDMEGHEDDATGAQDQPGESSPASESNLEGNAVDSTLLCAAQCADELSNAASVYEDSDDAEEEGTHSHCMHNFDDQEGEDGSATNLEGGGEGTEMREGECASPVEAVAPVSFEGDGQEATPHEALSHQSIAQALDGFSEPVCESQIGDLSESCPIAKSLNCDTGLEEVSEESSKLVLSLYRIDEEEECEDEDVTRNDQQPVSIHSQSAILNDKFQDVIPATTTHRIRVGTLPGSPIRISVRLTSIFEEDEMKSGERSGDGSEGGRESPESSNLYLESFDESSTDGTTHGADYIQTEEEDLHNSPHDSADGTLFEEVLDPSSAPDFTPTSPVQIFDTQDAGSWFPSQGTDALDFLDDGDSTWTNCSSFDGDSGFGPQFAAAAIDSHGEDALFAGEVLMVELDETEDRLDAAIVVVSDAIDLASEMLGDSGNAVENGGVVLQEGVQANFDVQQDDGSADVSFEHESDESDTSELENAQWRIDRLDYGQLNSSDRSEDKVAGDSQDILPPLVTTQSGATQITVNDGEDRPPSSLLVTNSDPAVGDLSVREAFRAPSRRSPFAGLYGSVDSHHSNKISAEVREYCGDEHALDSATSGDFEAGPQGHNLGLESPPTADEVERGMKIDVPKPKPNLLERDIAPSSMLLALWVLAAAGAALFGPSLLHLQTHPRCEASWDLIPGSKCHDVWQALAVEGHDNTASRVLESVAGTWAAHKVEQNRMCLLESDIIAACKLVVEMDTREELAATECSFLEVAEESDKERGGGVVSNDVEPQDESYGSDAKEEVVDANHYLVGLAFTLLAVAFLQHGRRA